MKYFLRVLCQKNGSLPPEEVVKFINDGFFFEYEPEIKIEKKDDLNWNIEIIYDREKDPVTISTSANDEDSQKELEEIKFILDLSKKTEKKESISKMINLTATVYTLQINQDQITDDCWEMLDATESMIMHQCNGLLFTSDNEFFDQKLKKIYKL